jgi:hypothetical protein
VENTPVNIFIIRERSAVKVVCTLKGVAYTVIVKNVNLVKNVESLQHQYLENALYISEGITLQSTIANCEKK